MFPERAAAPDSLTNVLPTITGTIGFLAGIIGVGLVTRRLAGDERWPSIRYETSGTVVMVLVTYTVFIVSEAAVVGLTQRLFIGVITLWVVLLAYRRYRLFGPSSAGEVDDSPMDPGESKPTD